MATTSAINFLQLDPVWWVLEMVWGEGEGAEPLWYVRFACCSSAALPTISAAMVYVALNRMLQGFTFC